MFQFFINRPIFASVISIVIVIAGLVASHQLPIAQYPQIAPPTIIIKATYPGASAETLAKTVAATIEEQLSGVEGLSYFQSSSDSNGNLSITATFDVGTDVDIATIDINNRVQAVEARLPVDVRRNGVIVQKRSTAILLVVGLISPDNSHDTLYLSNYASLQIMDELKRLPGIGDVETFGLQDYSMRIWLKPNHMAHLGITVKDITRAIRIQNAQYAAGKIGQEPATGNPLLVYTVTARGRLLAPEQFGNIILRANGTDGTLYLKDVARIELGAQSYNVFTTLDGQPAVGMRLFLQPNANALATTKTVRAKFEQLKKKFPKGMDYIIPWEATSFVKASIREVIYTLGYAALLVLLVVFIFLQSWRATLIPVVAVPVSLIGTFAGLWLLNFSINTLTLFAMILSIGIVVDDAIIVLENVERLMREHNLSPRQAAITAMREVSSAVIAIVLTLSAVFIPVAFLGGIAGKLYQQFAATITISVVISGIVALTLTPALCALILKREQKREPVIFRFINKAFASLTNTYTFLVSKTLHYRLTSAMVLALVIGTGWAIMAYTPRGFVPSDDQGYLIASLTLQDAATLNRTRQVGDKFREAIAQNPAVNHIFFIGGFDLIGNTNKSNAATIFIPLKPWEERQQTARQLAGQFMSIGKNLPGGRGLVFNPPAIRGLGTASGFEIYVQNQANDDTKQLTKVVKSFTQALQQRHELARVKSFYRPTVPQLFVEVDEAKVLSLGILISDVYNTLQSTMGTFYVNDFNMSGRTYRVQLQAESQNRMKPEDLGKVYVRSRSGDMIPLSAVIRVRSITGPEQVERFNGFLAAKVRGNGAAGISSGETIRVVKQVAAAVLPAGYEIAWTGQAFQQMRAGSTGSIAVLFAIVMVFLILAAQYETWSLPLAVILAVPFALFGALVAIYIRGMPNDIYFQIGMVTLIGLASKNAILIVEYAKQKQLQGMSVEDAAIEAARLRFRPIVMTSLAFMLGVSPLVIATGAGAAARRSMGTGVVGGMFAATFIATLFIPLFFVWLSRKQLTVSNDHLD